VPLGAEGCDDAAFDGARTGLAAREKLEFVARLAEEGVLLVEEGPLQHLAAVGAREALRVPAPACQIFLTSQIYIPYQSDIPYLLLRAKHSGCQLRPVRSSFLFLLPLLSLSLSLLQILFLLLLLL